MKSPVRLIVAAFLLAGAAFAGTAGPAARYITSFGINFAGQLGLGDDDDRYLPSVVTGSLFQGGFAAADSSSAVIGPDGRLYTWGSNCCGTLGLGDFDDRFVPTQVPGLENVTYVASGPVSASFFAIADGQLYGWGDNSFGQLGTIEDDVFPSPIEISGMPDIVSIAAGYGHTLVLDAYGEVYSFGSDFSGELGRPVNGDAHIPTKIPGLTNVIKVQAGFMASAVLLGDGTVWTFGNNMMGQLGLGDYDDRDVPTMVPGLDVIDDLSFGSDFMLAVEQGTGDVYVWGANDYGQLGLGDCGCSEPEPVRNDDLDNIAAVFAGAYHSFAIGAGADTYGWGLTQLIGLAPDVLDYITDVPTLIPSLHLMEQASLGSYHTLADVPAISFEVVGQTVGGKTTVNPREWVGGSMYTATARIVSSRPAGPGGMVIGLQSDAPEVSVPPTMTILEGEFESGPFTIDHELTSTTFGVTLRADHNSQSNIYDFLLAQMGLRSFKGPKNVVAGTIVQGIIQLTNATRLDREIELSSDNPAIVVPPFVTVPAGESSVTFAMQAAVTNVDTDVAIVASFNDDTYEHNLTVRGVLVQHLRSPSKVYGNAGYELQISLNRPAGPDGIDVTLEPSAGITVPTTVHFASGEKVRMVSFTVADMNTASTESIKALLGDADLTRSLEALPNRVRTLSLSTNTVSLGSGDKVIATVELMAPVAVDTEVAISLSNGRASAPITVTVPAGSSQATFDITPEAVGGVRITVGRLGLQRQVKLMITP